MSDDDSARKQILARRARFMAAALASVGGAVASCEKPAACLEAVPVNEARPRPLTPAIESASADAGSASVTPIDALDAGPPPMPCLSPMPPPHACLKVRLPTPPDDGGTVTTPGYDAGPPPVPCLSVSVARPTSDAGSPSPAPSTAPSVAPKPCLDVAY
jgi:hypothetical protein